MKFQKITRRRPISYYLGTGMMVAAVALLFLIYTPLLRVYLFAPDVEILEAISEETKIYIPKIGVDSPIILGVDPWNPSEYQEVLQHGIAHAQGTSLPGDTGTTFLFAHSSDVPWRITQYNTVFYKLGELDTGDSITIDREGKRYEYRVSDKVEVWPDETQYLREGQGDVLILQTCTPVGTSLRRLLIFAEPVGEES